MISNSLKNRTAQYIALTAWAAAMVFSMFLTKWGAEEKSDIRLNGEVSCGRIINTSFRMYRGHYMIDYVFFVEDKLYQGLLSLSPEEVDSLQVRKNDCLTVRYKAEKPEISVPMMEEFRLCDCRYKHKR